MPKWLSGFAQRPQGDDAQPQIDAAVAKLRAGDVAGAEAGFRQLLADAQRRGNKDLERLALVNIGATLIAAHRSAEAEPLFAQAIAIAMAQGNPHAAASSLYNLAWRAFHERDFDAAARLNAQAHNATGATAQRDRAVLLALMDGRLATRQGLYDRARQALAYAAANAPAARDPDLVNQVQMAQGVLEYRAGQRAGLDLVLAGAQNVQTPDRQDLAARWLTGLAYLAGGAGDQDAAQRLLAAAQRLAHAPDFPTPEQCASYLSA